MGRVKGRKGVGTPKSSSITGPRAEIEQRVDYGGVAIVNPPSTVVQRLLPGRGTRARPVTMDIRGFVPTRPSSVVTAWITEELAEAAKRDPWLAETLKSRRQPSWFDTTAHLVADIVFRKIKYERRNGAAWQLPEETLALHQGDCEDRATLLASALIAAGVSPYNVRVALGSLHVSAHGKTRSQNVAHAWVVYRAERGGWAALEPVPAQGGSGNAAVRFKYQPDYVFNGDHQWQVTALADPRMRRRWNALDPTFHGEVHRSIITDAAARAGVPEPARTRMSRTFTILFGNVIDEPDLATYDPRHHFDSGLIAPAWGHVLGWLRRFYQKPLTDTEGIRAACWAAHAIADFYAHSTYAHFLEKELAAPIPFNPQTGKPVLKYDYANDQEFKDAALSYYPRWFDPTGVDRLGSWKGRPISGRYSFKKDAQGGLIEGFVNEAPADAFPTPKARFFAGSLPHHDEIAVDEGGGDHSNKIYGSGARYAAQFRLRYSLAVLHIERALKEHPEI